MRVGVITFPGSLDERDAHRAVRLAGGTPVELWHGAHDLEGVEAIILPGGFSYGDYLRAGSIASHAPIMAEVIDAAKKGMPVLGICNGFQMLAEARLVPGAHGRNDCGTFVRRDQILTVENNETAWTRDFSKGEEIVIPLKNADGRFVADADTIKRIEGEVVRETIDRNVLRAAQTPQGFVAGDLVAAYGEASQEFTDDAALMQAAGHEVLAVEGHDQAFKVTTPEDLAAAEMRFGGHYRSGIGTDVHRFTDDSSKPLYLGTVVWPGERGLDGHSDGDAVSHAIVDAMLSAAGLGDIGSNFGVDRPEFAGANGKVFIEGALDLLREAGYAVQNIAVQIIGNRPKVAPHRSAVEQALTTIIGAPVTLSATTTDGLGFLGNTEGVAAVATALIAESKAFKVSGDRLAK